MRYRFSGLIHETKRPIEGNVTASTEDAARALLAENGVLAQKIWPAEPAPEAAPEAPPEASPQGGPAGAGGGVRAQSRAAQATRPGPRGSFAAPRTAPSPEPRAEPRPAQRPAQAPAALSEPEAVGPETVPGAVPGGGPGGIPGESDPFSSAIDSAFDASATNVSVDRLMARYRGQQVRVIDRDKIRRQVQEVVGEAIRSASDAAVAHTQAQAGSKQAADVAAQQQNQTLEKVAEALDKVFGDQKNLTSEAPSSTAMVAIEDQIARLTRVVLRVESAVNRLMTAGAAAGMGGGGYSGAGGQMPARGASGVVMPMREASPQQNKVLMEIFESNRELRSMDDPEGVDTGGLDTQVDPGMDPGTDPQLDPDGFDPEVQAEAEALAELASSTETAASDKSASDNAASEKAEATKAAPAKAASSGAGKKASPRAKKTTKKKASKRATKKPPAQAADASAGEDAGGATDNPPAAKKTKRRKT